MRWTSNWVATVPSPTHPDRNEDNYWISENGRAAAVIDGMGGYRRKTAQGEIGGEHASALASAVLGELMDRWDGTLDLKETKVVLRRVVETVNQRIWNELNWSGKIPDEENTDAKPLEELTVGVALTVVALCDGGERAVFAQHGDTHGYVAKEMGFLQITEDQDLLMWERLNGVITDEQAAQISQAIDNFDGINLSDDLNQKVMRYFFDKNIFGALGVDGACPETGWSVIKLAAGDRLALLSDGAYSNMSINELASLVAFPDDPASVIVELAMQRCTLARFPDANDLSKPYNMRATQDDMTAVILDLGLPESSQEDIMADVDEPIDDMSSMAAPDGDPSETGDDVEPASVPTLAGTLDELQDPIEPEEPDQEADATSPQP